MRAKTKKALVGMAASLLTAISALFWAWYASLPSFDQIDQSFNEIDASFQDYGKEKQ